MHKNIILVGDCKEKLKELPDNSIDAIVTDPPYEVGIIGKSWDSTGIAFNIAMWKEALRVLKPGGHLLAFGATRTYHRMACAIEDAGFECRDCFSWLYSTGFPKGRDISKEMPEKQKQMWDGWNIALKPAHEPIIMARKPIEEKTIAQNVMKYGTGAINIEDTRIGESGRWPSNVLLDEEAARILDEQAGERTSGKIDRDSGSETTKNVFSKYEKRSLVSYGDTGKASRFFYCAKPSTKERNAGLEHRATKNVNDGRKTSIDNPYQRGDTERLNIHPTVKPIKLMEYLITLITPKGGIVLDPFSGSGTTLIAAKNLGFDYLGIEMNPEYIEIANDRIRNSQKKINAFLE